MSKRKTTKRQTVRRSHFVVTPARVIVCLVLLGILVGAYFVLPTVLHWRIDAVDDTSAVVLHTVNVGHGDCTIVQFPDNKVLMVDTGKSSAYEAIINYLDKLHVTQIDWLVITHPDSDHYGSANKLLSNPGLTFGEKYCENCSYNNTDAGYLAVLAHGFTEPDGGYVIDTGAGYKITFVSPYATDEITKSNDSSLMLTIEYHNKIFVLAGDAMSTGETLFMERAEDIFANKAGQQIILKVGHHGSNTSSKVAFLDFIFTNDPQNNFALISANGEYGLPKEEIVTRLKQYCSADNVLLTKDVGDIVVQASADALVVNGQDYRVSYTAIFSSVGVVIIVLCFYRFGAPSRRK